MRGAGPGQVFTEGGSEGNPSGWNVNSSPILTEFQLLIETLFKGCVFLEKSGIKTPVHSKQVNIFGLGWSEKIRGLTERERWEERVWLRGASLLACFS